MTNLISTLIGSGRLNPGKVFRMILSEVAMLDPIGQGLLLAELVVRFGLGYELVADAIGLAALVPGLFTVLNTLTATCPEILDEKNVPFDGVIYRGRWGDWGGFKGYDKIGYFMCGGEIYYEDPCTFFACVIDDTAVNALRFMWCAFDDWSDQQQRQVSDGNGEGTWKGMKMCPENYFVDGGQAKFLDYQGVLADDAALTGLKIHCVDPIGMGDGVWVTVWDGDWGMWRDEVVKPGFLATRVSVRDEFSQFTADQTGVNGLQFVLVSAPAPPTPDPIPAPTAPVPAPTTPSTPTPPTDPGGFSFCFSGEAIVQVDGKGSVRMKSLEIGDLVAQADGTFSQVYSFGHKHETAKTKYLQVQTTTSMANHEPLEISAEHLIYMHADNEASKKLVPAADLKVGDYLVAQDGSSSEILSLKTIVRMGAYSPLTASGHLIVNGVEASNYVAREWVSSKISGQMLHYLQYAGTFPLRAYCYMIGGCSQET